MTPKQARHIRLVQANYLGLIAVVGFMMSIFGILIHASYMRMSVSSAIEDLVGILIFLIAAFIYTAICLHLLHIIRQAYQSAINRTNALYDPLSDVCPQCEYSPIDHLPDGTRKCPICKQKM